MESKYVKGSAEDVLEAVYQAQDRVVCVTGPVGSGKSTIATEVVRNKSNADMEREEERQAKRFKTGTRESRKIFVPFFFETKNEQQLVTCWTTVGKELGQLVGIQVQSVEEIGDIDSITAFRRCVAGPCTQIPQPNHERVSVVLDGVEDLSCEEQDTFWTVVSDYWMKETPSWLQLIVFACPPRSSDSAGPLGLGQIEMSINLERICEAYVQPFLRDEDDLKFAVNHILKKKTSESVLHLVKGLEGFLQGRQVRSVTLDDIWEMNLGNSKALVQSCRPYLVRFLSGTLQGDFTRYQDLMSCLVATRRKIPSTYVKRILSMDNNTLSKFLKNARFFLDVDEELSVSLQSEFWKEVLANRLCETHDGYPLHVKRARGSTLLTGFLEENPYSPMALEDLFYHFCSVGKWKAAEDLVLDFDWLSACVSDPGRALQLVNDAVQYYNETPHADLCVTDVLHALDLGLSAVQASPTLVKQQVLGRIQDTSHPIWQSYKASQFASTKCAKQVFMPLTSTLTPARSTLLRCSRVESKGSYHLAASDGRYVAVGDSSMEEYFVVDSKTNDIVRTNRTITEIKGYLAANEEEVFDWRFNKTLFNIPGQANRVALGDGICATNEDDEIHVFEIPAKVGDSSRDACIRTLPHGFDEGSSLILDGSFVLFCGRSSDMDNAEHTTFVWNHQSGELVWKLADIAFESLEWCKYLQVSFSGELVFIPNAQKEIWNWKENKVHAKLPSSTTYVDLARDIFFEDGVVKKFGSGDVLAFVDKPEFFLDDCFIVRDNKCLSQFHKYTSDPPLHKFNSKLEERGGELKDVDENSILLTSGNEAKLLDPRTGKVQRIFQHSMDGHSMDAWDESLPVEDADAAMNQTHLVVSTDEHISLWNRLDSVSPVVILPAAAQFLLKEDSLWVLVKTDEEEFSFACYNLSGDLLGKKKTFKFNGSPRWILPCGVFLFESFSEGSFVALCANSLQIVQTIETSTISQCGDLVFDSENGSVFDFSVKPPREAKLPEEILSKDPELGPHQLLFFEDHLVTLESLRDSMSQNSKTVPLIGLDSAAQEFKVRHSPESGRTICVLKDLFSKIHVFSSESWEPACLES